MATRGCLTAWHCFSTQLPAPLSARLRLLRSHLDLVDIVDGLVKLHRLLGLRCRLLQSQTVCTCKPAAEGPRRPIALLPPPQLTPATARQGPAACRRLLPFRLLNRPAPCLHRPYQPHLPVGSRSPARQQHSTPTVCQPLQEGEVGSPMLPAHWGAFAVPWAGRC